MSSSVSTIYDKIVSIVAAALPTYTRLPNPYLLEENAEILLKKGWGIVVADGTNTNRQVCGKKSYERTFQIALTNQITTTDHNVTARETIEKSLIEDVVTIFEEFEKNPTLDDTTAKAIHVLDGGLEYIEGDRSKYMGVLITVTCEFFENIGA